MEPDDKHTAFLTSPRKHVLMITNHGLHEWEIAPGLPDTGGQNVFVNHFSAQLARQGFRITIVNRGGYPHPVTGAARRGLRYKDAHQRILYIEDGVPAFVRKEEMAAHVPALVESLWRFLRQEGSPVEAIFSHYWDGLQVGISYAGRLPRPVPHVWVPHSLGAIKQRNLPPERWPALRLAERIAVEQAALSEPDRITGVAATSSLVERSLRADYGYRGRVFFLPPCVDADRFYPRSVPEGHAIWRFLSARSGLPLQELRGLRIVTEISRTDATKRKDVLIEAFARLQERVPHSLLVISLEDRAGELTTALKALIRARSLRHCAIVQVVPADLLPVLYAITDVYCTPSEMEGFGMSAQEAAACGVPVVASDLVPFANEYLLGNHDRVETLPCAEQSEPVMRGSGAIVVPAGDVAGFACALERLLTDEALRREMGQAAYRRTVPRFTWSQVVPGFLQEVGITP